MRVVTAPVRVGVLGCGNVGAALVGLLIDEGDAIEARTGLRLEVARVAVRNMSKDRPVALAEGVLTNDAAAIVDDPTIDVVVEISSQPTLGEASQPSTSAGGIDIMVKVTSA